MRQEIKDRYTPHVLLIGYLGYFVHLPVSDYSASPAMLQRARQTVCIDERESSPLFSPSLICSACALHKRTPSLQIQLMSVFV